MKEKTKFVAFSTQKGGAGKTTLTVLAASYLYNRQNEMRRSSEPDATFRGLK